jgi:hypothetical protein
MINMPMSSDIAMLCQTRAAKAEKSKNTPMPNTKMLKIDAKDDLRREGQGVYTQKRRFVAQP